MISLEEASKEISEIIELFIPELELNYAKVEHCGASIVCAMENGDFIKLQALPDSSRNTLPLPMNNKDYQSHGGHKELIRKFDSHNPKAWCFKLQKKSSGQNYEVHFPGNENSWNSESFKNELRKTFTKI